MTRVIDMNFQYFFFNSLQGNPLKTSPEFIRAGTYGKCVLLQNMLVFNGLKRSLSSLTAKYKVDTSTCQSFYILIHFKQCCNEQIWTTKMIALSFEYSSCRSGTFAVIPSEDNYIRYII